MTRGALRAVLAEDVTCMAMVGAVRCTALAVWFVTRPPPRSAKPRPSKCTNLCDEHAKRLRGKRDTKVRIHDEAP